MKRMYTKLPRVEVLEIPSPTRALPQERPGEICARFIHGTRGCILQAFYINSFERVCFVISIRLDRLQSCGFVKAPPPFT